MKTRLILFITAIAILFSGFFVVTEAASDKRVEAHGVLSSVESDGTIVIDDKGFGTDPSMRIIDGQGKRMTLDKISLPARISYEFYYSAQGPVIILIREIRQ